MHKTMIFINLLVMLGLLLSACAASASGGIQLPVAPSGGSGGSAPPIQNDTLIYVLIGAVVLIAVVALVKK